MPKHPVSGRLWGHEFAPSGITRPGPKGGRLYQVCRACDQIRLGLRHTPPFPAGAEAQAADAARGAIGHNPQGLTVLRRTASGTSRPSAPGPVRPGADGTPPAPPAPDLIAPIGAALVALGDVIGQALKAAEAAGRVGQAEGPPIPEIGVWQLDLLGIAVDRVLAMPGGSVSRDVLDDLEALRRHLRVRAPSEAAARTNGHQGPILAVLEPSSVRVPGGNGVAHGTPGTVASGKARRLVQSIRNREVRDVVRYAIGLGWTPVVSGSNHLRVTHPQDAGKFFTVSMTGGDDAHSVQNLRAEARRAGLDLVH